MRIAAISVAPVFPEHVIGGSQKILADLSVGLKKRGHDVQIWCTETEQHSGDFNIDGVPVRPDLKLRGVFPATHQVSPISLARTAGVLRRTADWADRVYLHADSVYLRHAIEGAQIVRSIHDYVYEEALVSTLSLPADTTVVPSDYLKRCVETTVALSGRTSIEPVVSISNGVKVPEPESMASVPVLPHGVAAREETDLILLSPHRPEPTKGVREAILTAIQIQKLEPARNVRLLMPACPVEANFDDAAGTDDEVKALAEELGGGDIVEFHDWLSPAQMPEYYAAGDVTLCLGSFIESFGLVPVESVATGTPAVCVRVGALRQFSDVDGITLVPCGDIENAAEAVLTAATLSSNVLHRGREQITARFSVDTMISEFESVITRFQAGERKIGSSDDNQLELAPWCDVQAGSIYDDYRATSLQFPELTRALESSDGKITSDPLLLSASLDVEVRFAVDLGILIPEFVFE